MSLIPTIVINLTDETTEFSIKTQADSIVDIFTYYGLEANECWAVVQTADNVAVNWKWAELFGLIHISCGNHLLAVSYRT